MTATRGQQEGEQETLPLGPEAEPPRDGRTAAQVAEAMKSEYWQWVESQTGRKPIALRPQAFKAIVTPFLAAGIGERCVRDAVGALYRRGETLTRAGLERELDGRGHRVRRRGQDAELAALRFDEHGNLID